MLRRVEPEWLDELPPDDPRAIRSRRDIHRLNAFMGNPKIMAGALRAAFGARTFLSAAGSERSTTLIFSRPFPTSHVTPDRNVRAPDPALNIVDLGAGDGRLMLEVAKTLSPDWSGTRVTLLDRQSHLSAETRKHFETLGWHAEPLKTDVLDWLRQPDSLQPDAIVANLFLHHFRDPELIELLRLAAARTKVFIAVEPRRWTWSFAFSPLFWVLGCGPVTRHDALISIRAGFAGCELSALWPAHENWSMEEAPTSLASHLFVAKRVAPSMP
ncbi:MAG: hypothetical protein QOJ40_2794 [Verrucomicrobiota bacterium]